MMEEGMGHGIGREEVELEEDKELSFSCVLEVVLSNPEAEKPLEEEIETPEEALEDEKTLSEERTLVLEVTLETLES